MHAASRHAFVLLNTDKDIPLERITGGETKK